MGRLIEARYENSDKGLSDKAIRDNILTFMIAGHEVGDLMGTQTAQRYSKRSLV